MGLLLGQQISIYRKKAGIRQQELAASAGVTAAALSQYENGKREPSLAVLTGIARALQTTPDVLLELKPPADTVTKTRDEFALLRYFRGLNALGQKRILDDIAGLRELKKYSNAAR